MKKKAAAFLLLAATVLSFVLLACSDGGGAAVTDTVAPDTETQEQVYKADIPDNINYEGTEFRILTFTDNHTVWYDVDFSAIEENAETINDAVYRRLTSVEEALKIDIVAIPSSGYGEPEVRTSVGAGDDAYDVAMVYTHGACNLACDSMLYDFNSIEELDLDAPWWDQNQRSELSVNNRLYTLTGDISIMHKKSIRVIYFNKQLAADNKITGMYDDVKNGTWTVDRLTELARKVYGDLNGDSVLDENDRYGFIHTNDTITTGLIGCGVVFVSKDAEDYPYLSFNNEQTVNAWNKFTDLCYDEQISFNSAAKGIDARNMFLQNQGLFISIELHNIEWLRAMESDFGILPNPLYDENQDRYYSTINPHAAAMLTMPITNTDTQKAAYVLDMLAAESKNMLTPAYYELYLKAKGARDDESELTLDIVFSTIRYDLGYSFNWGNIGKFAMTVFNDKGSDIVSAYKGIENAAERAMDKAVDKFKEMD